MTTPTRRGFAVSILLFATFMDLLDVTIVQVALPAIGVDLQTHGSSQEWVISGYLIAFAVALVTGGRLGDIFGRRHIFLIGIIGFTLASALCAGAWTIEVLVTARVVQGVFAAVMVPQLLSTLQTLFMPEERTPWYGLIGAITGIAAVVGPLLGGFLVDADIFGLSWRSIFLINVPIGLAIIVLAHRFVPETRSRHPLRVDVLGVILLSGAVLGIMVPLVEGRVLGWPIWLWIPLAAGIAVLIAFVIHCHRRQARNGSPVLPLGLFRNRGFSAGVITQAAFQGSMNAFMLPFVFYLQLGLGHSAWTAGLTLLAFSLGSLLATAAVVPIAQRTGKYLVTSGAVLMSAGILWTFTTVASEGPEFTAGAAVLPLLLAGIGLSAIVIPLVDVALADVPINDAGAASGTLTTFQQLGAAIGIAVSMTVFFNIVDGDWTQTNALTALRGTMVVAVTGLAIAAATSFALPGLRTVGGRHGASSRIADPALEP